MYIKVSNKVYNKLITKLKNERGLVIEPINKEAESYLVYLKSDLGDGVEARSDSLKVRIKEEGKGYKDISGLLDAMFCLEKHTKDYSRAVYYLINGEENREEKKENETHRQCKA